MDQWDGIGVVVASTPTCRAFNDEAHNSHCNHFAVCLRPGVDIRSRGRNILTPLHITSKDTTTSMVHLTCELPRDLELRIHGKLGRNGYYFHRHHITVTSANVVCVGCEAETGEKESYLSSLVAFLRSLSPSSPIE